MTTLYANPYCSDYSGFYFDTIDQFNQKMSQTAFEETEIDFIDGDNPKLFNASNIHQGNLNIWFEELDQFSDEDDEALSIMFLVDFMDLDEAIQRHNEVILYKGSIEDYVTELIEEIYPVDQLPEIIRYHIDYSGIARDMELNSEVTEISRDIWVQNNLDF